MQFIFNLRNIVQKKKIVLNIKKKKAKKGKKEVEYKNKEKRI